MSWSIFLLMNVLSKAIRIQTKPLLPHSLNRTDRHLAIRNQHTLCGALFTDLAKAFDVFSHDLFLRKLTLYGLSANTLSLICSFFNSRLQKVSLKDNQSDLQTVLFGDCSKICPRTSPVLHLYKRTTFTYPFCTMWHVSRWHDNSHLWTGCTCNRACPRTSPVLHLYKRPTFTYPFCTMWHVSRWHDSSHLWTGCTCNSICSPVMSLWCCWMDTSKSYVS